MTDVYEGDERLLNEPKEPKKPINMSEDYQASSDAPEEETEEKAKDTRPFCTRLMSRYDNSFLFALGMQYFNTGMRSMVILAVQNLFESVYTLGTNQQSLYMSYINLPWAPKLVYGILTDSFPICGSGKRSYVVVMGIAQFVCLMMCAIIAWPTASPIVWFTVVYSTGGAFMEVVCQGLMVVESRKDPESGSEDL